MNTENKQIIPMTRDQAVTLAVEKIREAVRLGPDRASASTTELIMIAFADCDRRWLTTTEMGADSRSLWKRLNAVQRAAVAAYLD